MSCETCLKSGQINQLEKEIEELKKDRNKTREGMHNIELTVTKIEGKMDVMSINVDKKIDVMSAKLDPFIKTVESVEKDNEETREKPGKLFDKIISAMSTGVVAALVAAFMSLILK